MFGHSQAWVRYMLGQQFAADLVLMCHPVCKYGWHRFASSIP